MAFPQTPLDVRVEFQLGSAWTDVTSDVYLRDRITIDRGRADEGSRSDPGKCRLTLNNRGGQYSPRNPTGPNYGLIGRNTPCRVSVPGTAGYLTIEADGDKATTPDVAALDIVGDIDVRLDVTLDDWLIAGPVVLAAKYDNSTTNRSWMLLLSNGVLTLQWSANGTAVIASTADTVAVIPPNGRLAVRATLDVDNGAGGNTVTFYTSTSVGGTWTQLGSAITQVGTTSIFASTAALGVADAATLTSNLGTFSGRVHAFQLRSGIAGSVVANPDFTVQSDGATAFVDSAGRTWTVGGAATISTRSIRFRGEVSAWPPRWDVSGKDVYVPIEGAGILRRAGQGDSPTGSTLRIALSGSTTLPVVAYWPCEDASEATSIAAGIPGVQPMTITGTPQIANFTGFACSDPLPVLGATGVITGQVPTYAGTGTAVRFLMALPSGGATAGQVLCGIATTGSIRAVELYYDSGSGGRIALRARGATGSIIADTGTGTGAASLNGTMVYVSIEMTQVGGNVELDAWTLRLGDNVLTGASLSPASQTIGIVTSLALGGALADTAVGHISVQSTTGVPTDSFDLLNPLAAYATEQAGDRIRRLAANAGLPVSATGDPYAWTALGAQQSAKVLDLLAEAADADLGIFGEHRTNGGLSFRGRTSLYNQAAALALSYAGGDVAPPLEPVPDDQTSRNDIEVKRKNGSSARAVLSSGPLSVLAPPAGIGRYDDSVTLNVSDDEQLPHIAGWKLHLGTWDEERYPHISVDLAAVPALTAQATALDLGDRVTISNPPAWLPPDAIDQLVWGYTETLGEFDWDLVFNCGPARPWQVAVLGDTTRCRLDTGGSTLVTGVGAAATSLSIATATGPIWTTTDTPFDVVMAGERMTVTAVTGAASPQTFTVVRAVNGVSKSQLAGAAVQLYQPMTLAL